MFTARKLLTLFSVLGLFGLSVPVFATPFTSALSVSASASFDTVNSADPDPGASQSGNINLIGGGSLVQSLFNGTSLAPSLLTGALTDFGDGVGMRIALTGNAANGSVQNPGVFGDLLLAFNNNSASEVLTITLQLDALYGELFASGSDAYILFDTSLKDEDLNELLFSNRTRDTVFGDNDSDSVSSTFTFMLNPGQTLNFAGLVQGRGGAYQEDSSYSGYVDAFLRILSVRGRTTEVPTPTSLTLFGLGLVLLGLRSRSRPDPNV